MGNSRFYTLKNIDQEEAKGITAFCKNDPSMEELMDDAVEPAESGEKEKVDISVWFNMNEKNPSKDFELPLATFMRENQIGGELWEMEEYGGDESLIFCVQKLAGVRVRSRNH